MSDTEQVKEGLVYEQCSGRLYYDGGLLGEGYSGKGLAKNQPAKQHSPNAGPIPVGHYTIGTPFDSTVHGRFCLGLTPHEDNIMFGRWGFLIHGDSIPNPGEASEGCIVLPLEVRQDLFKLECQTLTVVASRAEKAEAQDSPDIH